MTIVLIGVLPSVLFFWGRAAILALGDARRVTKIVTAATLAQFATLFALTPFLGAYGGGPRIRADKRCQRADDRRYLRRKELLSVRLMCGILGIAGRAGSSIGRR